MPFRLRLLLRSLGTLLLLLSLWLRLLRRLLGALLLLPLRLCLARRLGSLLLLVFATLFPLAVDVSNSSRKRNECYQA